MSQLHTGWDAERARTFCETCLPAWTVNDPERLLSFYTEDAFYSDPVVPKGVSGRKEFGAYLRRMLAAYPDWRWTHRRSLPIPDGFLNYWEARSSDEPDAPSWEGVCVVQLRDGKIFRNEVFLDRTAIPHPSKLK